MTARASLTRAKRARIFLAAEGRCHICNFKIDATKQKWEAEHVKPLWLGGADDETNMRPAHVACHARKSADEAPDRARSTSLRAAHLGIKRKPKGRPLPGTRASGIRKRMSGQVERW